MANDCVVHGLESCILPLPAGARKTVGPTGKSGSLTPGEYLHAFYPTIISSGPDDLVDQLLTANKVRHIMQRSYTAANGDSVIVVLLSFDTPVDAGDYVLYAESDFTGTAPDVVQLDMTNLPESVLVSQTTLPNKQGELEASAFGYFDDLGMEMFFFSAKPLDTSTFSTWLHTQLTRLQ